MKLNHSPIIVTMVAALVMAYFKSGMAINGAEEAIGTLLVVYMINWLLIMLVRQPLKLSIFKLVSIYKRVLTFASIY